MFKQLKTVVPSRPLALILGSSLGGSAGSSLLQGRTDGGHCRRGDKISDLDPGWRELT